MMLNAEAIEATKNRFPILMTVIDNLSCDDTDKEMLFRLFSIVYHTGIEDAGEK
jgi:hypothetical protein